MEQLRVSESEVKDRVMKFVTKAAMQTGTELTPMALEVMAEDLIDCYKHDSLEDIAEALKKGRQGRYGKVFGKLTGVVMAEWMNKHLEEKAHARETEKSKYKIKDLSLDEVHEAYVKKIEEAKDSPSKAKLIIDADRVINKTLKKYKA